MACFSGTGPRIYKIVQGRSWERCYSLEDEHLKQKNRNSTEVFLVLVQSLYSKVCCQPPTNISVLADTFGGIANSTFTAGFIHSAGCTIWRTREFASYTCTVCFLKVLALCELTLPLSLAPLEVVPDV